jgi:hypothetical protein
MAKHQNMKSSILLAMVLVTGLIMSSFRLSPGTLTPEERKYAVDYFTRTRERLLADVKGLSEAQLNWKADSTRWSVYQCVEHIALAESWILQPALAAMKTPATPDKRAEVKFTPDQIIAMLTDRSHKFQAPEPIKPVQQFADTKAAIHAFLARRDSTIEYLKNTQDDLKDHFIPGTPLGTLDVYDMLIFLSAHTARHTLQLEEVMANPNFPKQ